MKTDFKLLLSKLSENNIDFIVIGGFAAAAYGYNINFLRIFSASRK